MSDSPCYIKEPGLIQKMRYRFRGLVRAFLHWAIYKLGGVPSLTDGNLVTHAKYEMNILWPEPDDMQDLIKENILDIIAVFAGQGHSGISATYIIPYVKKLMNYELLSPLEDKDEEWMTGYMDDDTFQNKRLSSIFRKGNKGKPYYLNAIIWTDESGCCFTGSVEGIKSSQYINFPFIPKSFYIDVVEVNEDTKIKDHSQLKEVFEYYNSE